MRIAMIGSGYVGLVSGACLADFGHHVVCIDRSSQRIDALKLGEIPIYEPGLERLVREQCLAHRLSFTTEIAAPVAGADVVFIAVGTPSRRRDGHADLTQVYEAAYEIARELRGFTVLVTKSTVPVGTGDEVERIVREARPDADFAVASNPEFLREGTAIRDFKRPDRIVVGVEDDRARDAMSELYRPLRQDGTPMLFMSRRTAELTKYASNAFLAMKITFMNEMADLCEALGADVQDAEQGLGLDKRIGPRFLRSGPGFGGSCFPKDTLALAKIAQDAGVPARLVESTIAVNDQRKRAMGRKVISACGGSVRKRRIGVLGLTFKPNTDDVRESPAISLIQTLQDNGAIVAAFDPKGMEAAQAVLGGVAFRENAYAVADGADAIVIATEWGAFRALDFTRLKGLMRRPLLIDLRNVYARQEVERYGFGYVGVGQAEPMRYPLQAEAAE